MLNRSKKGLTKMSRKNAIHDKELASLATFFGDNPSRTGALEGRLGETIFGEELIPYASHRLNELLG